MTSLVVGDRVLDAGLNALTNECDKIFVCSAEPTTYTEATSTVALGSKTFTRGTVFGAPAAGTGGGRTATAAALTGGSIATNGTVAAWAAVDSTTSRLLSEGAFT